MMTFDGRRVIPAARSIKDFESAVRCGYKHIIMLEIHLSQVNYVTRLAHEHGAKVFLHADLIDGLKSDEAGVQFLCQEMQPDGLISTHTHVVTTAMKRGLVGIQRVFLLDSHSMKTIYSALSAPLPRPLFNFAWI